MDKQESTFNFLCESKDWAIWFGQAYNKNFKFNIVLFYTQYKSAFSSFAPWDLFEARLLFMKFTNI